MSVPSVQVPVSLATRLLEGRETVADLRDLRALLSQPTPTAEPERDDWNAPTGAPWDTALRPPAAPPGIADMVPGTTFLAPYPSYGGGFWTVRAGVDEMIAETYTGDEIPLRDFDPSTIRDVQPPKET